MARKNTLIYRLLEDQSLDQDFTSDPTLVKNLDNCCYQINVQTTDSEGTFKVQASLNYDLNEVGNKVVNEGDWFDLDLSGGIPSVSGEDTIIGIDLNQLPFNAIRLVYTSTTPGTGACSVYISAKQIGG